MSEHAGASARPPHGSLAEEAVKLAEVAQLWLRDRSGHSDPDDPWAAATAADDGPPECRTCPVCRATRFVRDMNPEVLDHLSEAKNCLNEEVFTFFPSNTP
jgi:hypothetical protein